MNLSLSVSSTERGVHLSMYPY